MSIKHNSGRNKNGHLVLYTRSKNYHSKIYRLVNFNYTNFGIPYTIFRIEYDPNRSAFINLVYYFNNLLAYFLNITTVLTGDHKYSFLRNTSNEFLNKGDSGLLRIIPENTIISIIEKIPTFGAIYTRAAGTYSILVQKHLNLGKALIKLKSGLIKMISLQSKATVGVISNLLHKQEISGKAGRSR
jgi:large subunit ribosomal protein L2